jgi:type II restriction enzyme
MNLTMDPSLAAGLSSRSQVARKVTEAWAANNLFCLACSAEAIGALRNNTPVRDFMCPECKTTYQLKSKNGRHGNVVSNSAYQSKIDAIKQGRAPNYAFLDYDRETWKVRSLFVVPGHFISESVIRRRNPLPTTARRAGWVGSNILLSKLPHEGRILVVSEGSAIPSETVRENWNKFRFLKDDPAALGGWGADVLALVRLLESTTGQPTFTLLTFYTWAEEALSRQHPDNHNVRAKIRQQLQVLRDGKVLDFVGRGRYRVIG